ncbi:MAG: hypothetical protein ACFFBD_11635 [Candidatus Hodarchaeota archaeon]
MIEEIRTKIKVWQHYFWILTSDPQPQLTSDPSTNFGDEFILSAQAFCQTNISQVKLRIKVILN